MEPRDEPAGRGVAAAPRGGPSWVAERPRRRGLALAAALPPLALAAAELYVFGNLAGWPLDDSWIHLVFARSLAAGDGLSYGGGPPVPASTAPLWTALVAALSLLPGSLFAWVKLAGIAAQVAAVDVAFRLGRALDLSLGRATLAATLVASSGWLVWSALSGMEISLAVLLVLAGLLRHVEERRDADRPPLSLALFGLAALARPEALLLLPLALADRLLVLRRREDDALAAVAPPWRRVLIGALAALLLIGAVAFVHWTLWGSPLPTTLAAKSGGEAAWRLELRFVRGIAGILFEAQPWLLLLAAGGAVELLRRTGGARDRGLLLPLWVLALPVASVVISSGEGLPVGNFGRYLFPLLAPLALLAVLALEPLAAGRWPLRLGPLRLPGRALGLALLLLPSATGLIAAGRTYLQARANVDDSDVAVARWIHERVPPEATLALCDVGAVKYLTPNPILDLAGLVHPEVIERIRRARREEGLDWPPVVMRWLEERRPDYVVLYPRWLPLLEREPARFPVLLRLRIPDNVTMAGDELVVYATPWTRYPLRPEAPAAPRSSP